MAFFIYLVIFTSLINCVIPQDAYTDFDSIFTESSDDEVEYFDSRHTEVQGKRISSQSTTVSSGTSGIGTRSSNGDLPAPATQTRNQTETKTKPEYQFGSRDSSLSFSPNFGNRNNEEEDFEYGFFGTRRNEFVEVRIGEFSTTDQFARIYGKLANYSSSLRGEAFQVSEFLGIPFAEPPNNLLKFQRPVAKAPPDELLAFRHSSPCPQISESNGKVIGNEDCLYLSIYVPGEQFLDNGLNRRSSKLPILVWFHGESREKLEHGKFSMLTSGSAQDLDPLVFLQNKIIVVTPQYRLGSLGFLSVANEDLNGNMGLLDQITALEWVQRYMTYFGGDPNQITVMGQGSSAVTLGLLSTSTSTKSLFQRMILMSGSPASPFALDPNQKLTYLEIARQNNCPSFPTLQLVRCMQKRGMESLVQADAQLIQGKHLGKFKSPLPVIQKEHDARFLPPLIHENPIKRIAKGKFQNVPIMIGVTSSEMSGFLSSLAGRSESTLSSTLFSGSNVLRQFVREVLGRTLFGLNGESVAQLAAFEYFGGLNISERQEQAKDLVEEMLSDYLFNIPALTLANKWSPHAPVYFYVFDYVQTFTSGNDDAPSSYGTSPINVGNGRRRQTKADLLPPSHTQAIHGSDLQTLMQGYKGSAQDRHVANIMIDAWSSFIRSGSPLQSGLEWPTYGEGNQNYLYIGDRIQIRSRFRARQQEFWTELLEEVGEKSVCSRISATTGSDNSHYEKKEIN